MRRKCQSPDPFAILNLYSALDAKLGTSCAAHSPAAPVPCPVDCGIPQCSHRGGTRMMFDRSRAQTLSRAHLHRNRLPGPHRHGCAGRNIPQMLAHVCSCEYKSGEPALLWETSTWPWRVSCADVVNEAAWSLFLRTARRLWMLTSFN